MKFYLDTEHPIALDSPDHIEPRGTWRDNTVNLKFNERLLELYEGRKKPSVLDFGCAGGGMVKSFYDMDCIAIGLEGSDYNLQHGNHEWVTIPDNLFTCDLGYPFTLHTGDHKPYRFDVITAWEFLEHIPEERVLQVIENMRQHIKSGGLVIGSISDMPSVWKVLDHHQTKRAKWWWVQQFGNFDFQQRPDLEAHFDHAGAWVRSVKYNFVFQDNWI